MMKQKKTPLRKCVGCQEMKDKREMIRIVLNKDGEIRLDFTGKAHGRGAYLCRQRDCFEKAAKSKSLNRAFKKEIPEKVYQELEEAFREEKKS